MTGFELQTSESTTTLPTVPHTLPNMTQSLESNDNDFE